MTEIAQASQCLPPELAEEYVRSGAARGDRAVERHLAACSGCRELVSLIARDTFDEGDDVLRPLRAGDTLGRYVIEATLGAGAMGTVYAARDPQLDRRVAIKVLRPELHASDLERASHRRRLEREARIMASVAHPAVVHVYDVGVDRGMLFVAAELIDGVTLRGWLDQAPRSVDEILAVFGEVARGLSAVHDRGIVHRDIKPDNILCARDGRVCVGDFGLAAPGDAELDRAALPVAPPPRAGSSVHLTATGMLIGTPAYMAPEQLLGRPASAQSDQFSFCACLHEALYGRRPLSGDSLDELRARAQRGEIDAAPGGRKGVPRRVQRALTRGLSASPDDRFASMEELRSALALPGARRRHWVAWALTFVMAGWIVWSFTRSAAIADCEPGSDDIRALWNESTRRDIGAAFRDSGLEFAPATWEHAAQLVDDYVRRWEQVQGSVCILAGARSGGAPDVRAACLRDRMTELASYLTAVRGAGPAAIASAHPLALALRAPEDCRDHPDPAPGRADSESALALSRRLSDVNGLVAAGELERVPALAGELAQQIERAGNDRLGAQLALAVGTYHMARDEDETAREQLERAVTLADAAGDPRTGIDASARLVAHHAADTGDAERASYWSGRVQGYAAQIGVAAAPVAQQARCWLLVGREDPAGLPVCRGAALISVGDDRAKLEQAIAILLQHQGDFQGALAVVERLARETEDRYGAAHPRTLEAQLRVSFFYRELKRYDEASELAERALRGLSRAYGERHPIVAAAHVRVGQIARKRHQLDQAAQHFERALAIRTDHFGPDHPTVALALGELAQARHKQKRYGEAHELTSRAIAIARARWGLDHPRTLIHLHELVAIDVAGGRYEDALATLTSSLPAIERVRGPLHFETATQLFYRGVCLLELGRAAEAIEPLERSAGIFALQAAFKPKLITANYHLSRALWLSGRDRGRALSLAREEHEWLVAHADNPAFASLRGTLGDWLRSIERGGPR